MANIGVIGSGDVGQALARGFLARGDKVKIGTREPSKLAETGIDAAPLADVAKFGDILVLATAWSGTENAIKLAGPEHFRGKLVLDITNPLSGVEGGPIMAVGHTDSGGERVQKWLPGARVVKTLNLVNCASMVNPDFQGGNPTMFLAGNDESAKRDAKKILHDFGWKEPVDLGDITAARHMEALVGLWVLYGMRTNVWDHGFRIVRP